MSDKPSKQVDASSAESPAQRKKHVEDTIAELQNANRLGVHMWEGNESRVFPNTAYKNAEAKNDLLSLSLIPTFASGQVMEPYGASHSAVPKFGYLFNLDQKQTDPATVYRVLERTLESGHREDSKDLRLSLVGYASRVDELNALYAKHAPANLSQDDYVSLVENDADHRLSAKQLDLLGSYYEKEEYQQTTPHPYNEVITNAGPQHIAAIVGAYYRNLDDPMMDDLYKRSASLCGALEGLVHLQHDVDLPVMLYHLNGLHAGQSEYIAQGAEELKSTALSSLATLQNHTDFVEREMGAPIDAVMQTTARILNMDVEELNLALNTQIEGKAR